MSSESIDLERSMIHLLIQKAKDRPIPGLLQESTQLYKNLVQKIRKQLINADRHMDPIEVELTVRKLASWMEDLVTEASKRSLRDIQAKQSVPINSDKIKNTDEDKILVEELPSNSDLSTSFIRTDVETQDKNLINVLKEGLKSTKYNEDVQNTKQALDELQQTLNLSKNNINSLQDLEENLKKLLDQKRTSMCDEEWVDFVKSKLLSINDKEKLTELKNILEPIVDSDKNIKKSTTDSYFKTKVTPQSLGPERSRMEKSKNNNLRNKHRDLTPSFHNRVM